MDLAVSGVVVEATEAPDLCFWLGVVILARQVAALFPARTKTSSGFEVESVGPDRRGRVLI